MNDRELISLWEALDKASFITGAWTGVAFDALPPKVRQAFHDAVARATARDHGSVSQGRG